MYWRSVLWTLPLYKLTLRGAGWGGVMGKLVGPKRSVPERGWKQKAVVHFSLQLNLKAFSAARNKPERLQLMRTPHSYPQLFTLFFFLTMTSSYFYSVRHHQPSSCSKNCLINTHIHFRLKKKKILKLLKTTKINLVAVLEINRFKFQIYIWKILSLQLLTRYSI